jgi:hypothetical protein
MAPGLLVHIHAVGSVLARSAHGLATETDESNQATLQLADNDGSGC